MKSMKSNFLFNKSDYKIEGMKILHIANNILNSGYIQIIIIQTILKH